MSMAQLIWACCKLKCHPPEGAMLSFESKLREEMPIAWKGGASIPTQIVRPFPQTK